MSGGHWDYQQLRLSEIFQEVSLDPEIKRRFPKLSKALNKLGPLFYEMIHDLDYDLSGDSSIDNEPEFEKQMIKRIRDCLK